MHDNGEHRAVVVQMPFYDPLRMRTHPALISPRCTTGRKHPSGPFSRSSCDDVPAGLSHVPATLGFVRRSGDAVSKLDRAANSAERLEAFAGSKDRNIAIVEHAPED